MSPKGRKYLTLFLISLGIMFLGSTIYVFVGYVPLKTQLDISFEEYLRAIEALQNYYSNELYSEGVTWQQHAAILFADEVLFENIKLSYTFILFTSYIPLGCLLIFALKEELKNDFIKFKKKPMDMLKIIGLSYLGMIFLVAFVAQIYEILGIEGESANEAMINLVFDSKGLVFMIISVCLLAPLFEELVYRKLLFGVMEESFKLKPVYAIALSTFVFSLIHVSDVESMKYIFQYMALALPICVAYYYSDRNIYVVIIIHLINNTLATITTLYG